LGTISLPEAEPSLDHLLKTLSSPTCDPNVKAMCVWSLGRLPSPVTGHKSKKLLALCLRDSYWKVRAAACTAVAQLGESVAHSVIPVLTKILRDGTVNRQTVAETMINVGPLGEQTLVQILKNEPENNMKLRECIIRALALANVNNPNVDFVIEVLF
jgi:HEAT repeat protein